MKERVDGRWQLPARVVERERLAFHEHRRSLSGGRLAAPSDAPRGTFIHGFLLPFSLIVATLRDPVLRRPFLRVFTARTLVVAALAAIALANGKLPTDREQATSGVVVHREKHKPKTPPDGAQVPEPADALPVTRVDLPGIQIDMKDEEHPKVAVLGHDLPEGATRRVDGDRSNNGAPSSTPVPPTRMERVLSVLDGGRKWGLALLALLSTLEMVVVFPTRRYDDWLSFFAAGLARVKPEEAAPKPPKIALELGWLWRKLKRRVRGYLVFGAGVPALLPLRLVPTMGTWLFSIGLTLWGWYWLGVFSAAKSAHAWVDEERSAPPAPLRALLAGSTPKWWFAPLRWYASAWRWATKGMNPAVTTFERSPWPFLGLALSRAILAFPGFYFLGRPIIPVAAGRLCAEADPENRFSSDVSVTSTAPLRAIPADVAP